MIFIQLFEKTVDGIKAEIAENYTGGLDTRPGSYFDLLISPVAYEIYRLYKAMEAISLMIFPTEESGEYIDAQANTFGIYRKSGTCARADMELSGTAGLTVYAGTRFVTEDGLAYELENDVFLANGSGAGTVAAIEPGSAYNVPEGAISNLYTLVPGLNSFAAGKAAGGTEGESNASLLERYLNALRYPSAGGNEADYRAWAMEVSGVDDAYVIRRWNGINTVKVIVSGAGSAAVGENIIATVSGHIESRRPVGADVTVESITEKTVNVSATAELLPGADIELIRQELTEALRSYFADIGIGGGRVSFNQISHRLLGISGVNDYTELTLNGKAENISLSVGTAAVCGVITVSEAAK